MSERTRIVCFGELLVAHSHHVVLEHRRIDADAFRQLEQALLAGRGLELVEHLSQRRPLVE